MKTLNARVSNPNFTVKISNTQRERPDSIMKTPSKLAALGRSLVTLLLALALSPLSSHAQPTPNPPGMISYQGFVVDANGIALATNSPKNYNIIFRIYNQSSGDTSTGLLFAEQQTVTIDRGYFSVLLGQGTATGSQSSFWTNNLTYIFSGNDASDRYIGITVVGLSQGGDVEITPRLRLLSSPYSFLSANSLGVINAAGNQLVNTYAGFVGVNKSNANPTAELDVNGTVKATLFNGNGANITGLNAGNLATGSFPDSVLSGNVPKLNAYNQWSGYNWFKNAAEVQYYLYMDPNADIYMNGSGAASYWDNNLGLKLSLWSGYNIGIQNSTMYFRSGSQFAWYAGGSHNDGSFNSGGGTFLMSLDGNGTLGTRGDVNAGGYIHSPHQRVSTPIYASGGLPHGSSGNWYYGGGSLSFAVSGSGRLSGTGQGGMYLEIDGAAWFYVFMEYNVANAHQALTPVFYTLGPGYFSVGNHTITMVNANSLVTDGNDGFYCTIVEYPY